MWHDDESYESEARAAKWEGRYDSHMDAACDAWFDARGTAWSREVEREWDASEARAAAEREWDERVRPMWEAFDAAKADEAMRVRLETRAARFAKATGTVAGSVEFFAALAAELAAKTYAVEEYRCAEKRTERYLTARSCGQSMKGFWEDEDSRPTMRCFGDTEDLWEWCVRNLPLGYAKFREARAS